MKTLQKHYERFNKYQVLDIMEDGFSYVYTFNHPYNPAFYTVFFSWRYFDNTTKEYYDEFFSGVPCTTEHFTNEVLARLQKYDLGSGLICPDISRIGVQIKMIGDTNGDSYSMLESHVVYCLYHDY